jgi:acyl-coenzyme A synthetase/AMP-(fatty) acid ligase
MTRLTFEPSPESICDGEQRCSYAALPPVLMAADKALSNAGLGAEDCILLACDNTLPSALSLLALLHAGRSFVMVPHAGAQNLKSLDTPQSITFCRWRLEAGPAGNGEDFVNVSGVFSLRLTANTAWKGSRALPARIYLPTSGSTGEPKIARYTHEAFLRNARNCVERFRLMHSDRVAIPVPIFHMYGLGAAFLPSVLAGASIDLQPNSNLLRLLARQTAFAPNVAFLTPSFCETALKVRSFAPTYRLTVVAGDRLRPDLFDRYESRAGTLVNLYGSTELGAIAAGDPADPPHVRREAIGRLMPGVELQNGSDEAHELSFRHAYGFESYVRADGQETDGGLQKDGVFRTNDLGRLVDGCLHVTGRVGNNVKRDGVLIALSEVEKAILAIDGVEQVVVIDGEDTARGKALLAFCVVAGGNGQTAGELRAECAKHLPSHVVPDRLAIVPKLPLLANGKIDRQALRRQGAAAPVEAGHA